MVSAKTEFFVVSALIAVLIKLASHHAPFSTSWFIYSAIAGICALFLPGLYRQLEKELSE